MKPAGPEAKWSEGVYLSLIDKTSEYIIGTPNGCVKSSNAKRLTREEAADPELIKAIVGKPWKLTPSMAPGASQEDIPAKAAVVQSSVKEDSLPPQVHAAPSQPRRVYIRKEVELARYGYTDDCPGCMAAALGTKAAGHSVECRARIEREMSAHPEGSIRLGEAQVRRGDVHEDVAMDESESSSHVGEWK